MLIFSDSGNAVSPCLGFERAAAFEKILTFKYEPLSESGIVANGASPRFAGGCLKNKPNMPGTFNTALIQHLEVAMAGSRLKLRHRLAYPIPLVLSTRPSCMPLSDRAGIGFRAGAGAGGAGGCAC